MLLACRQWDPLGLARRLPSLRVGACRSVPLLPWRVQCPVRVCAALAAGSGGSGQYLVLCLSRFPPSRPACPALRVAGRTLARWYAIPRGLCVPRARSGCPSGSPRVPFACMCARAPAASAPPPLSSLAWAPRAVPALGAGRGVPRGPCPSACPAPVLAPSGVLGGGRSGPGSPLPGCCCEGRLRSGAPPPRLLAHCAGCWGPLPTCCGRRCVGVGAQHCPLGLHALWGLRAAGLVWWGGVPRGGWPATVVRGVWCQALSLPRPPVLWAGCRGPLPTGFGCGVVRAWGPITNPTERALASWLCALPGRHEGARGGAPPARVWGVWGRALSHPRVPALWAGCRGPLPTGCGCGGVRAWGPVTNPTARALACCRGGMRVPGGGASCLGVGGPGSGALPPPTARPPGGLPRPTTHWLWVRGGAGVGTRHQSHSARSCELALRAVGAA